MPLRPRARAPRAPAPLPTLALALWRAGSAALPPPPPPPPPPPYHGLRRLRRRRRHGRLDERMRPAIAASLSPSRRRRSSASAAVFDRTGGQHGARVARSYGSGRGAIWAEGCAARPCAGGACPGGAGEGGGQIIACLQTPTDLCRPIPDAESLPFHPFVSKLVGIKASCVCLQTPCPFEICACPFEICFLVFGVSSPLLPVTLRWRNAHLRFAFSCSASARRSCQSRYAGVAA